MINFEIPVSDIISDTSSNVFIIKPEEPVWSAVGLMTPFLENYTDAMVVKEEDLVFGVFGGREILWKTMQNPNWQFFKEKIVKDLSLRKIKVFQPNSNLNKILEEWGKTKFNFSLVKTDTGYKNIFSKNFLKYFSENNIAGTLKDIPQKPIVTFSKDDTVEFVIKTMIESGCRKLVLEGTHKIIDDRRIVEKIVNDYNYLKDRDDFLNENASIFATKETLEYPPNLEIEKICSIMLNQNNPTVFSEGKIITQFDIIEHAKKLVK